MSGMAYICAFVGGGRGMGQQCWKRSDCKRLPCFCFSKTDRPACDIDSNNNNTSCERKPAEVATPPGFLHKNPPANIPPVSVPRVHFGNFHVSALKRLHLWPICITMQTVGNPSKEKNGNEGKKREEKRHQKPKQKTISSDATSHFWLLSASTFVQVCQTSIDKPNNNNYKQKQSNARIKKLLRQRIGRTENKQVKHKQFNSLQKHKHFL